MAKHKMYDESPSIKHDAEGKTKVEKAKKPENTESDSGAKDEKFPIHVRHAMERRNLQHMHENEHGIHDVSNAGDKKEMHGRHASEIKAMNTRHEKEAGAVDGGMAGAGGSTSEPIEQIEKGAK